MQRLLSFLLLVSLLFTACQPKTVPTATGTAGPVTEKPADNAAKQPRNIILLIGDGMGISQITAGIYSSDAALNLERFPVVGLHKSYSGDNLITDSAAGATAFSAGIKTYNGAIAMDMDRQPVGTILEELEALGWPTGLIATSTIVHATPASFIAHNVSRNNYEQIATGFLDTEVDLMIGGGGRYFNRRQSDQRDLYEELRQRNYLVSDSAIVPLRNLRIDNNRNLAYFTADGSPARASEGRDYLPFASELAVRFLDQRTDRGEGFFLMIEGSQIDWGGHDNDGQYIIDEMADFDAAIGKVLDWAERDGQTLVIVTADHETGGFAINSGSTRDSLITGFTSDYHTADLIPVFAYGPGAQLFSGIYENTAIYHKMRQALKLKGKRVQ